MPWQQLIKDFRDVVPGVDFWSLRLVADRKETLSMRAGLRRACDRARQWLETARRHSLFDVARIARPQRCGSYQSRVVTAWESWSLADKLQLLRDIDRHLKISASIVDRQAQLSRRCSEVLLVTSDGVEIEQTFHYLLPGYAAVANAGTQTQMRSGGGWGSARQGGLEQLAAFDFPASATRVAEEALALVAAPECPGTTAALLLLPSQMMLQIHESIGHPLELDRILGDERNYAGLSFVTVGAELLLVTGRALPHLGQAAVAEGARNLTQNLQEALRFSPLDAPGVTEMAEEAAEEANATAEALDRRGSSTSPAASSRASTSRRAT